MATNDEPRGIQAFHCRGDSTSVGPRWRRWRKVFQFYVDGRGITAAARKKALLLHCAGMEIQEIFETLTDPGVPEGKEDNVYNAALRTLDAYFSPQVNVPYERHIFRQMKQEENEMVDQFIVRLSNQAANCEFGVTKNERIRDQIIDKCKSTKLRRKLLEKGQGLTLTETQKIARWLELSQTQSLPEKFTREVEEDGKLPFLDCLVSRDENTLRTTVYRKPTHTYRLLDESSYNPTSHKATTIKTLTRRAQLVCNTPKSLSDENKYLQRVFDKNNYKDDFIRRNAHRPTETTETNANSTPTTTATIPYIKGTSETIARILQPYNIRVAHKPITTLRHLLTNVKDKDEPNNRQGAVYKIKCSDCQASYIGETGRNLKTRLTEHKRATRNGDVNNHIAEHHRLTNHTIDWDSAQCVTYSTNYFQRLTLESWFTN